MGGNPPKDLPAFGDPHPEIPNQGLIVRSYSFAEADTGMVTDVSVVYATSNAGTEYLYSEPDLSGTQFVFSASFGVRETEIPMAVLDTYTITDLTGSQVDRPFWNVKTVKVPESYMVIQAQWQLAGQPLDMDTLQAFQSQHNKIHQINGKRYLFSAGAITPRDNNTYEVTGSWTSDEGTAEKRSKDITKYNFPLDMGYTDFSDPASIWPNDGTLTRSPFHTLSTVPSEDPSSIILTPLVVQVPKYEEDLFGYLTLPGVPLP